MVRFFLFYNGQNDEKRECAQGIFRHFKHIYWVDAKVSADFLKNVFKRCSATMDAWFSCI